MRAVRGFTLIELLVVISIISILSVVGFVNFKGFSSDQVTVKAAGEIQTLLRLTQSNATSSTMCNSQGATSWSLIFLSDAITVELHCDHASSANNLQKTYTLENASVAITGASCSINLPATIRYLTGTGAQSISSADTGTTQACLDSSTITFTLSNTVNPNASPKPFNVSKGGAINVQ